MRHESISKVRASDIVHYGKGTRPTGVSEVRWQAIQRQLIAQGLVTPPQTIKTTGYGAGTVWHCTKCDEGISHFTHRPAIFHTNSPTPKCCPKCGGLPIVNQPAEVLPMQPVC